MEFHQLIKLFDSQDVLSQVEDSIDKNLKDLGADKIDYEVSYE